MDELEMRESEQRQAHHERLFYAEQPASPLPAVSQSDLHAAIMNLPCDVSGMKDNELIVAYKSGHRDARHAAAELAASHINAPAERGEVAVPQGWKLVPIAATRTMESAAEAYKIANPWNWHWAGAFEAILTAAPEYKSK